MQKKERLLEQIDVVYDLTADSDLPTDCIRLGRTVGGEIRLYFWGRGDQGAVVLDAAAAQLLFEQLVELRGMSKKEEAGAAPSLKRIDATGNSSSRSYPSGLIPPNPPGPQYIPSLSPYRWNSEMS